MKIDGPLEGHGHAGVVDVSTYREIHRRAMTDKQTTVFEVDEARAAYVNHSRWVVDCDCHGAGLARVGYPSCCFDCGRVYLRVDFPSDVGEIEALLLRRRDPETRNWIVGQTVADLSAENSEKGV